MIPILFVVVSGVLNSQTVSENLGKNQNTEWIISRFLNKEFQNIKISGNPKMVNSPYGKAVYFDGIDDAFFLNEVPLKDMDEFTVEMIFNPAIDGDFEQRVVHMGEISGNRMLLEIRAVDNSWYFDGFVASGENKLALIDEKLIHPLGQWYHVALVVTKNSLSTYVNGKLELTESFSFSSIETGQSSVGVRLNKRSWFKGIIYKIKVSPKKLNVTDFMSFKL
ncbi:LamG-like jellyroll fold domain-containing protein [Mariniflexile sp. HNIBRBA6329]|uniref:LamG-like jellyroll fold domain-containing protein n=1 Tax=Mariniflexile sp. HNIBRBA6329 TaxID=3373088 RepID=UPI0037463C2F